MVRRASSYEYDGAIDRVEPAAARVSDRETKPPRRQRVWQTVIVTSGRIITGWRVGT